MRLKPINTLSDGRQLFAFWANNRGRGNNNSTLQVAGPDGQRGDYSRNSTGVQREARTSSWRGNVNLSRAVCRELGISKTDIVEH